MYPELSRDKTVAALQKGDIGNAGPLASRLASQTAYLLGANVPRMNIFKASETPNSSVRTAISCCS